MQCDPQPRAPDARFPGQDGSYLKIVNQNKLFLPLYSPSCVGAGGKVHVCMNIERQGECIHVCSHMYVYELVYRYAGTEATGADSCVWRSDLLLSSRLHIKH